MKFFYKILFTTFFIAAASSPSYATNDGLFPPEQRIKLIQVYPNPATTSINFENTSAADKNFVLTIYNFIGKKVDEVKLNNTKTNLSLDNYYRGLYVYQLRDKQGMLIESGKFQVIK